MSSPIKIGPDLPSLFEDRVEPVPDAIQWHEGMLLAPQHFQQLALRQDALLHYHAALLWPFHWGVRRLRIDDVLLGQGTLRVTEIEAVMPDGLVVAYEGSSPVNAETDLKVDLKTYAEALQVGPVTVHLAVPKRAGLSPVKGALPRYKSFDSEPVADENTGEGTLRVPRLRPRLTLLVTLPAEDKPPAKYVSFPLARISYVNAAYVVTDQLPPVLSVPLSSPLGELCTEISHRLREKALFLAKQAGSPAVAASAPQLLETRAMVQSLVAALPAFEAVLKTGVAHPFALYLALAGLVGNLAGVSRGLLPPVLDPYDHNDPWAGFTQARDFIFRVIDESILESFTAFPFDLQKGVFSRTFEEEWRTRRLVLGVRGKPGAPESEAAAWMQQCVIGSESCMPGLRDRRVPGAVRTKIDRDGDLVPSTGVTLFAFEADLENVKPNQVLQIWNPADRGETRASEVILYVRNRVETPEPP